MAKEAYGVYLPGWRDDPSQTGTGEHGYYAHLEPNKAILERLNGRPVPENGRALDVGVGSGRHAIWLAQQGWHVTGIDTSESEIRRSAERARAAGVEVDFEVADVASWSPRSMGDNGAFDLIVVAFLHLPNVFRRVTEWLKPQGVLLIVLHAPDSPVGPFNPRLRPSLTQLVDSINPPLALLHAERRKAPEGDIQLIVQAERPLSRPA